MNRGRQNGKRHKKTHPQPVAVPVQLTGTHRVMLDNTVPGGVRLEHTPNPPQRETERDAYAPRK